MEKDTQITEVVFRKFRKGGDIIALFPYDIEINYCCSCYQHIGQHGTAGYQVVINMTVPAKPEEYADLKAELENCFGYNLKVVKKISHKRYMREYFKYYKNRYVGK